MWSSGWGNRTWLINIRALMTQQICGQDREWAWGCKSRACITYSNSTRQRLPAVIAAAYFCSLLCYWQCPHGYRTSSVQVSHRAIAMVLAGSPTLKNQSCLAQAGKGVHQNPGNPHALLAAFASRDPPRASERREAFVYSARSRKRAPRPHSVFRHEVPIVY